MAPVKPDQGQAANTPGAGTAGGARTSETNTGEATRTRSVAGTPMIIGQVGTFGGPVGNLTKPLAVGVQAWVRMVNDRGGIGGHRIGYIQVDDGADPARYRMALQDLIEHRGVIAFVMNTNALSGSDSATKYLEEKRVPVLGGDLGTPVWATSWIHFPNGTTIQSLFYSALATIARLSSNKRLGSVVCAESPTCGNAAKYWEDHAAELGLEYVYGGRTSLAAPDFTAECLAARRAGAQVLAPFLDTSSIRRLNRACARQGYHPQYLMLSSNVSEEFVGDPDMVGSLGTLSVFPPSVRGTPATDEFAEAIRRYVGEGQGPNGGIAQGWEAAKLFEKAAANLGEPPSRERLLDGLWTFNGETLGGLAPPLTFKREQPAGEVRCWFMLQLETSGWRAAQGLTPACR